MNTVSKSPQSRPYRTIAKAIAFLDENARDQPSLATVAEHVHLSEFHFQRLFSDWVGISPKRYLQFRSLEFARARIARSDSLNELAWDTGLSGQSRLHDLFVQMEAITPGEYKREGQGLTIRFGSRETPFGQALVGVTDRGICHLEFVDDELDHSINTLQTRWPLSTLAEDQALAGSVLDRVFNLAPSTGKQGPLSVLVKGTNFQIQVWQALLRIPFGDIKSYGQVAEGLTRPRASRAVGTAIGQNHIAYLIPCHRVIRGNGELSYYRWGQQRKGLMLAWESAKQLAPNSC